MEKCKWVDGVFKPCDKFNGCVTMSVEIDGITQRALSGSQTNCDYCGANIRKSATAKYRAFKEGEMPVEFLDYYYQRFDGDPIHKAIIMDLINDPVLFINDDWWFAKGLFDEWQYKKSLSDPEWLRVGVKQIIGEKI